MRLSSQTMTPTFEPPVYPPLSSPANVHESTPQVAMAWENVGREVAADVADELPSHFDPYGVRVVRVRGFPP